MRTKFLALSFILVLALVLSGCSAKDPQPAAAQVPQPGQAQNPPTINVNGSAQVTLTPDIAYVSVGVHSESANADEAVSSNNSQAQKVVDAIKALGVDVKDIRTSNFSITPQQQFDDKGKLTGVTYVVDNTVYVTLHDLAKIGDILTAAVSAGANNIYGVSFDVIDKTTALANARKLAVQDAQTQASSLAEAAGVKLGDVQSINYYNSYPVMAEGKGGGVAMSAAPMASVPVTPGQLTFTVDVNIVYLITK